MKNPKDIEHFKQHFLSLRHKKTITDLEFLVFCKEACVLVKKYWDIRSAIATRVSGIAFSHRNDLAPIVEIVGDLFMDLEVPDGHIYLEEGQTVDILWQELEEVVDRQLVKFGG